MKGRFITLEGGEGAGKSSNLAFIRHRLEYHGIEVVQSREPGGTPLGERLRDLLLNHQDIPINADAELLLMFAARAQHIRDIIEPALEQGRWVLCDRFTDATYAYQGGGRGMSETRIQIIEEWVQRGLQPDLTLLLDLPIEVGLQRANDRSQPDRFESEKTQFFEQVRAYYRDRAKRHSDRIRVVDARHTLSEVQEQIRHIIDDFVFQTKIHP